MTGDMARIREQVGALDAALDTWTGRDTGRPQPEARQAANQAIDLLDDLARQLYELRGHLADEMRDADDAALARADVLLRQGRDGQAGQ